MRYRINSPQISSETIDGETIVIDFVSGAYFSSEGIGAVVWEALLSGQEDDHIIEELKRRYSGHSGCAQEVTAFIEQLQEEKLILPVRTDEASLSLLPGKEIFSPEQYKKPVLNKYTDMQDLLLLDPIHETDEQGWPFRKEPQKDPAANAKG